jgi:hypothetical protein
MISALSRFAPLITLLLTLVSPAVPAAEGARGEPIGVVDKVENEVQIASGGQAAAIVGAEVRMQDELRSGADGRLKVTFRDSTVLILGANAIVVVDRYVLDPDRGAGEILLKTAQGAFRFVTGKIKQLEHKSITVVTPVASSAYAARNFGVDRSTKPMACSCLRARSACRTRRAA